MSTLTMENPLSPSPKAQLARNLQDVQDCIQELKSEFEDSGVPINDDNQTLHRFCAKLEYLLQAGLKARSGLLGGKKDYWNYICDCVSSVKGLSDGVKFVKSLSELKTSLGRGRALIRFGLVHQRLADTIQQCVCNTKVTLDWYLPHALWLQQAQTGALINTLYDLNDLQFDLSPRGYDLDTAWPTFARKTFGSQQLWTPPSRSISINSLASTQENLAASFTPNLAGEQEVNDLKQDLNDMENDKLSLQGQVEQLQKGKQEAEEKAKKLECQLHDLQLAYSNFQVRYEKVATELKTKDDAWAEKEALLKAQIAQASRSLGDIRSADASNFDITELRLKLLARDKTVAAQQIEMKAIRLELDSKTKMEAQKSRLIELLDRKIDQMEHRYKELEKKIKPVEEAADKPADAPSAVGVTDEAAVKAAVNAAVVKAKSESKAEAEAQIKDLRQKLKTTEDAYIQIKNKLDDSEKLNVELRGSNEEFLQMLHSMEEKGMKIAKIAKEKLTSYSDANKQLKADMATLSKSMTDLQQVGETAGSNQEAGGSSSGEQSLRGENEELKQNLASALGKLAQVEAYKGELEAKIKKMEGQGKLFQQQMSALEQKLDQQQSSADQLKDQLTGLKTAVKQSEPTDTPGADNDKVPLESKIKAIIGEKTLLRVSLRSAEAKSVEFSKQMETSQQHVEELETMTRQLQLENAELKTVISQMEVKDADLGSKVEKLELDLQSQESEISKLSEQLQESLAQCQQLQNKVKELDDVLHRKEETIRDLSSTKEGVDKEFSTVQSKLVDLLQQREELQGTIKQLETKVERAEKQVEESRTSADVLNKEIKTITEERDSMKLAVASLSDDVKNWEVKYRELEENLSRSVEEKLLGLQNELKQEKNEHRDLEQDMEHLRKRYRDNEEQLKAIQSQKEIDEKDHTYRVKELEEKIENLLKDRTILNEDIKMLTQDKCDIEKSRDHFQGETARLQSEVDKSVSDVTHVKQEMESLRSKSEESYQTSSDTNDNLKEEIDKQTKACISLQEELSNSQSALKCLESEFTEAKSALTSRDSDIKSLKGELETITKDKEALSSKLTQAAENIETLKNELNVANFKVEQTLGWKSDLEEKITSITQEKAQLETSVSDSLNDKEGQSQKLVQLQNELKATSQELSIEKEKYADVVAELESTKSKLIEMQDSLSTSRDAMDKELSSLRFQLSSEQMQFQDKLKNIKTQETSISDMAQQVAAQESTIETLELELEHMKRQKAKDQEQQRVELEDLRQLVRNREEECMILGSDLKRTGSLLDEERNLVLKMKNDLAEEQKLHEKEREISERENHLLHNDNIDLKKKLIRLVKDKETLWLKTDKLEFVHKLLGANKWMEDGEVTQCLACRAEFSFRLRKHHCRLCGRIFCHPCSSQFIMTPHSSKKERVCKDCFILQNQVKMPLSRDQSPALEDDGTGDTEERNYSWSMSQSGTSEGDTEEGRGSPLDVSHEKLTDVVFETSNKTSVLASGSASHAYESKTRLDTKTGIEGQGSSHDTHKPHPDKSTENQPDANIQSAKQNPQHSSIPQPGPGAPEEHVKFQVGSQGIPSIFKENAPSETTDAPSEAAGGHVHSAAGQDVYENEAEAEPEIDIYARETDEYKLASTQGGTNPSAGFDDEMFDLITDDEIAHSIHEPNPDPNMYGCPTLTFEVIGPEGLESPEDLWVLPGKVYLVPVEVGTIGAELAWEFTTEHKNIYFSVIYKENDLLPNEEAEVLIPTCKCNSHKHSIQGELVARKTGIYSLLFDNSASRFTSKKLNYKLRVKLPDAVD